MILNIHKGDKVNLLLAYRHGYDDVAGKVEYSGESGVIIDVESPAYLGKLTLSYDTHWCPGSIIAYRERTSVREGYVPLLRIIRTEVRQESNYRAVTDGSGNKEDN